MKHRILALLALTVLAGCANGNALRTDLSARPIPDAEGKGAAAGLAGPTEQALKAVLREPLESASDGSFHFKSTADDDPKQLARYVAAGMTLSDIYCDDFFRRTNDAYRKRKFGRGATNDVGTAVAAMLGLASADPKVVSAAATSFGLADSTWRNYDDSFMVSPQLATMRSLVLAAQDRLRIDTLKAVPKDYMTARSAIVRYASICSFLGMQGLLDQSIDEQRRQLGSANQPATAGSAAPAAGGQPDVAPSPTPSPSTAPTATPAAIPPTPAPGPAARVPAVPVM